jgi:hypothetical protein
VYAKVREEFAKIHSEYMTGRETWNKGRKEERPEVLERIKQAANYRQVDTLRQAEGQAKRLEKMQGYTHSEETRRKIYEATVGKKRGPMSEEQKQNLRDIQTGVPKCEGHGDKVAAVNRGMISINKDGIEKKVKQNDLALWLDQGWKRGGRKRLPQNKKGTPKGPQTSHPE